MPSAATEPVPPGGDIDELIRLGEIGHVRKIMEKLDEIERGRPDCGDFVIRMRTIMNAFDLADELQAAGVTVNALHPATFMPTKMVPVSPLSTIAEGVEATLQLIAAPSVGTGRYYNGLRASRAG